MPDKAISLIRAGEVVAFPTETVYGLGADARNRDAVAEVFRLKGRPADNPLIIHIAEIEQLHEFASEVPDAAETLARYYWPGPLTLVLPRRPEVLDIVTGGLPTVAIRMPDHPLALDLIRQTGPLVAPSANKSGGPSPTKAEHVSADFGSKLFVLDGGSCRLGLESTVVRVDEDTITILRPGHIDPDDLEQKTGLPVRQENSGGEQPPSSPGMKYSHYAPAAKVHVSANLPDYFDRNTLYIVAGEMEMDTEPPENVIAYSGNLTKLAEELYDRFRQADLQNYHNVVVAGLEQQRSEGLHEALLNRIQKASM